MFYKILIADRGEFAIRLIRTCNELGIKTVAIYSTAERDALHLKYADETICVGAEPISKSYQNIEAIISAAEITNCEAIHPGYGAGSENLKLANLCDQYGIKYIGQSVEVLDKIRNKLNVKKIVKNTGVHTLSIYEGFTDDVEELKKIAKKISYPFAIKASLRTSQKNLRICRTDNDIEQFIASLHKFSDDDYSKSEIFIEKHIDDVKVIDFQVIADVFGNISHFSERDCSLSYNNKTVIFETPSPLINDDIRKKMGDASIKIAKVLQLTGLFTIQFLVDKNKSFYFNDIFTNVQPQISVTEESINIDLLKEQIKIYSNSMFSKLNHFPKQHSIGIEILAEDFIKGSVPSIGKIQFAHLPSGHGVRVESSIFTNINFTPQYNTLLAHIICSASNRTDAIAKLTRCINNFESDGINNNVPFLKKIIENKSFTKGDYSSRFFEQAFAHK